MQVYALLLCAQDLVEPNNVAQSLVGRCNEVVQILESHLQYSAAATAAAAVASNESNAMNSNNNYQLQAMDKTLLGIFNLFRYSLV